MGHGRRRRIAERPAQCQLPLHPAARALGVYSAHVATQGSVPASLRSCAQRRTPCILLIPFHVLLSAYICTCTVLIGLIFQLGIYASYTRASEGCQRHVNAYCWMFTRICICFQNGNFEVYILAIMRWTQGPVLYR